jgi:hypothetical protein
MIHLSNSYFEVSAIVGQIVSPVTVASSVDHLYALHDLEAS